MSLANPSIRAPLKAGAIRAALASESVTPPTRNAIQARLDWSAPARPSCFAHGEFVVLESICDRLIPQDAETERVPLAGLFDESLRSGRGKGWRYEALPPNRIAMVKGVNAVDRTAKALFLSGFAILSTAEEIWVGLPSTRFFEELLASLVQVFYAHPIAQERIGYIGMADAQGFHALGLNRRDPVEDEASDASL